MRRKYIKCYDLIAIHEGIFKNKGCKYYELINKKKNT